MHRIAFFIVMIAFPLGCALAQHQHDDHSPMTRAPSMQMPMEEHGMLIRSVPAQRDASGTAWKPDASAMYAAQGTSPGWTWMFHSTMFLRLTAQDAFKSGDRGNTTMSLPNWFHVMGKRRVSERGQLALRGMFSAEPATESGDGYPLLFQTGEAWHDQPLTDRQHPHDLIGELAASWGQFIGNNMDYFAYLGLAGEPALGPPVYLHRPSAQHNPDAPLSHHWQDATHITYGVATLGLRISDVKLDASVFNGREPDDNRFDIDQLRFDSYSGRLTVNPSAHWSVQGSLGWLNSPEQLEPETDVYRYTASALYHIQPRNVGIWTNSLIWGMNQPTEERIGVFIDQSPEPQHSLTLESDLERSNHAYYTRIEWVQKSARDLGFAQFGSRLFNIGALTLGGARDIARSEIVKLMLGGQGTFYAVPNDLQPEYGSQPFSFEIYLRLSPSRMM